MAGNTRALHFEVDASKANLSGIDALMARLAEAKKTADELSKVQGAAMGPRTAQDWATQISSLKAKGNTKQDITSDFIAKNFFPSSDAFKQALGSFKASREKEFADYFNTTKGKFNSTGKAAEFLVASFSGQVQSAARNVVVQGGNVGVSVTGKIDVVIPASQFNVTVAGQIPVAGGAAGSAAAGVAKEKTKKDKPSEFQAVESTDATMKRRDYLNKKGKVIGTELTELDELERTVVSRFRKGKFKGSTVTEDMAGALKREILETVGKAQTAFRADAAFSSRGAAAAQGASQLSAILANYGPEKFSAMGLGNLRSKIESSARVLRAQAGAYQEKLKVQLDEEFVNGRVEAAKRALTQGGKGDAIAKQRAMAEVNRIMGELQSRSVGAFLPENRNQIRAGRSAALGELQMLVGDTQDSWQRKQAATMMRLREEMAGRTVKNEERRLRDQEAEEKRREQVRREQQKRFNQVTRPGYFNPPPLPGGAPPGPFSPSAMATNFTKVASWGIPAFAFTSAFHTVTDVLGRAIQKTVEFDAQATRLGQVFRGSASEARALAGDVQMLAVANGRGVSEAMEAAIAYSRLGLSRREANEAVRVSLMAANVAELDAGEATTHLITLMQVYKTSVWDLNGMLGQLNNTSNKFSVTNADLLEGLSKAAPVAKQAGVQFAELQGLIAGVVASGSTGSQAGNALKTIFVRLGSPETQNILRQQFGVESLSQGGGMKSGSEVLRELFVKYQGMDDRQRGALTAQVAGATQASRFTALLESYVTAQERAIDAQLHLNSAELENAKIKRTLRSEIEGLKSAWDTWVVSMMNRGGEGSNTRTVTSGARAGKNLLQLDMMAQNVAGIGLTDAANPISVITRYANRGANMVLDRFSELVEERADPGAANRNRATEAAAEMRGKAGASEMRLDLLQTLQRAVETARPDTRNQRLADLRRVAGSDDVDKAIAAESYKVLLYRQAAVLREQAVLKQYDQDIEQAKATGAASERIAYLRERRAAVEQMQFERVRRQESAKNNIFEDMKTVAGESAARLSFGTGLAREALPSDLTGAGRMQAESAMELMAARFAQAMQGRIERMPGLDETERALFKQQTGSQIRGSISRYAMLADPSMQAAADEAERLKFMRRRNSVEFSGYGVGPTEAERLKSGLERMERERDPLRTRVAFGGDTPDDNVRLQQLEVSIAQTRVSIQERLVRLKAEEKQILSETQRMQERQLLFAGSGEMLQRLAVRGFDANGRGGAGRFLALDPALRRMVDESGGGEAMARNRREQSVLAGLAQSPEAAWQEFSAGMKSAGAISVKATGELAMLAIEAGTVVGNFKLVSETLQEFRGAIAAAIAAANSLNPDGGDAAYGLPSGGFTGRPEYRRQ